MYKKENTMKNFWKWILGIVIVLVVLFGLGIGARLLMASVLPERVATVEGFVHPMMGVRGFDRIGGMDGFGGGMMRFGGGFMRFGWLVPLALFGLVIWGVYRLGRHNARSAQTTLASAEPASVRTCTKCGHQVQEGWHNCANCGNKL
jgi:hypothetical protein